VLIEPVQGRHQVRSMAIVRLGQIGVNSSIAGSAVFDFTPKGSVIGETGSRSMAEEIPAAEFRAQIALVRAAKDAIRNPSPSTLGALRSTRAALDSLQPPTERTSPSHTAS
jgi:hypothetical protein